MTTELETIDQPGRALEPVRPSENLLAQVIAAAKDPSIDADKMKTLAGLVNDQQDRERLIEFNRDLNAAIMEMPVISKDGLITIKKDGRVIQSTKFAKFEDIDRIVRPILKAHNLAIRFEIDESGGQTSVRPILTHNNGHVERGGAMRAPIDSSGSKNNVQGTGSTVSYLKRYTMCATLNIITEGIDDDGNGGQAPVVSMAHEREQLVLREAEAAHEAGAYPAHFATLGPKDRAWLISSGHHVRLGGQLAIGNGGPTPRPDPGPPPSDEPPADQKTGGKRTPAQMVDDYLARLTAAKDVDELLGIQSDDKIKAWLAKLAGQDPAQHQRAVDGGSQRFTELTAAANSSEAPADGSLL